jgi:hypothetical protein
LPIRVTLFSPRMSGRFLAISTFSFKYPNRPAGF